MTYILTVTGLLDVDPLRFLLVFCPPMLKCLCFAFTVRGGKVQNMSVFLFHRQGYGVSHFLPTALRQAEAPLKRREDKETQNTTL